MLNLVDTDPGVDDVLAMLVSFGTIRIRFLGGLITFGGSAVYSP